MAGYVVCPYTPDEWRDILKSANSQLLEMQLAVSGVRKMERRATAETPGYDIFPIDDDANAAMQTVMNSKWGNILGDIGSAASLALFRYKFNIAAGRPVAYLTATISIDGSYSKIVANAGEPFTKVYGHATQGDMVTIRWVNATGMTRTYPSKTARSIATSNTLLLNEVLNPSLVVNGGFSADTDWTKGVGWTIAGGVADAAGAISTAIESTVAITVEVGVAYEITFTMTRAAGDLVVKFDGVTIATKSLTGTYTVEFTATDTSGVLLFLGAGFTGTLDNVGLREKMPSADDSVEVELEATYVP